MNIQGVEILTQKTLYAPQWFGSIAWIIFLFIAIFLFITWAESLYSRGAGIASCFTFALFLLCMLLSLTPEESTFLNRPIKIQYEIEVTDNNAWKELGPNYKVLKKIYETKEIYLVEGDYVE